MEATYVSTNRRRAKENGAHTRLKKMVYTHTHTQLKKMEHTHTAKENGVHTHTRLKKMVHTHTHG